MGNTGVEQTITWHEITECSRIFLLSLCVSHCGDSKIENNTATTKRLLVSKKGNGLVYKLYRVVNCTELIVTEM